VAKFMQPNPSSETSSIPSFRVFMSFSLPQG
jgi:hypothetical protein